MMIDPNRYFDCIYCISLVRRPDRWRQVAARLRRWRLRVEKVEAVDGWQCVPTAVDEPRVAAMRGLSAGELGCLASHRRTIEDAQRRGLERVLVLEDDVCFHRRFMERFQEVEALSGEWDLLYLGCSQYDRRGLRFVNPFFYRAHKTLGTFAYAIERRLFGKFLEATKSLGTPVDAALGRLQDDPDNNCLAWQPPLVIADVRDSDVRPARDQKRHAAKMQWPLEEYEMQVEEGECPEQAMMSGFERLPICRFRRPVDRPGLAECGHPRVRATEGLVSAAACGSCELRQEAVDGDKGRGGEEFPVTECRGYQEECRGYELPVTECRGYGARPRVLLAIDRFGWAFHADAEGLMKRLSDEFEFTIVPHGELARHPELVEGDLLVAFWWESLLGIDTSRVGAVVCGLFDTWSWDVHGAAKLQEALDKASVLAIANAYILDDLRNHPAGFRPPACFVCEEGVDCDIFRPQPFPAEFCVGWAGTTANARGFRGERDGKGLGLIQEAAKMAGVRLVAAQRTDVRAGRTAPGEQVLLGGLRIPLAGFAGVAGTRQIAHEAMPQEYYRHISVQCVGSYSEGAPLTVAEALACGRPVISTNVGVVPQLVQHGVNGLIARRDAASLAAAMRELKRIGPETMTAAARRSALLFDWSRQAPKWAHCFRSAMEFGGRGTHAPIAPRPEYESGEWVVKAG